MQKALYLGNPETSDIVECLIQSGNLAPDIPRDSMLIPIDNYEDAKAFVDGGNVCCVVVEGIHSPGEYEFEFILGTNPNILPFLRQYFSEKDLVSFSSLTMDVDLWEKPEEPQDPRWSGAFPKHLLN